MQELQKRSLLNKISQVYMFGSSIIIHNLQTPSIAFCYSVYKTFDFCKSSSVAVACKCK